MKAMEASYVISFSLPTEGTSAESVLTLMTGSARIFFCISHTQVFEGCPNRRGPRRCLRTFAENVLMAAVCHDSFDLLRYLIEEIVRISPSDGTDEEAGSAFRVDDEIISKCADAFRRRGLFGDQFRVTQYFGETILHQASRSDNVVWIRVLLEAVWPLNTIGFRRYLEFKSKTDVTPLMTAVAAFRVRQAELLIARGASLSSITRLSNSMYPKSFEDRKSIIKQLKQKAIETSDCDSLYRMHDMLVQALEKADIRATNRAKALCLAGQSDSQATKSMRKGVRISSANSKKKAGSAGRACPMPDGPKADESNQSLVGETSQAGASDASDTEVVPTVSCDSFSTSASQRCASSLKTDCIDRSLCVICLDAEKAVAIVPCGHVVLCWLCASMQQLRSCPVCRQKKESIIRVYI
ncbi:hypothetical protein CYMTET_41411 [Cymbomonas tetramitiformis]|uniref:RING-type domain-containing protein n=1 Tax=Cymbomonas tetramitiformis TaxID=36881 RepID=A0AAE0C660_9CHLO|nr:hypothetical protein CYMTET_41411 [Cymbomonas tetramitiformis]